jgi:hypothetical protein
MNKAPIYKTIVLSFGVTLAGQCLRYAVAPREDNTVAPYPMVKPEAQETLEMAAVYERNAELLLALQGDVLCDGQVNMPMFEPCGQLPFDPLPVVAIKPDLTNKNR